MRIAVFTAIAFAVSWGWWGMMWAKGLHSSPGSSVSHLPGLLGPAIAAIVVTAVYEKRAGLRALARRCIALPRPKASIAAILIPIVMAGSVLAVQLSASRALPPLNAFTAYPGVPAAWGLAALPVVLLINGFGEEIGWRGWLFHTLAPQGRIRAVVIVAAIWALWHAPLFAVNASMSDMSAPTTVGWLIGLVLGAFVLAHVYVISGQSILTVALWHTVYNYCVATPATQGTIAAATSTLIMIWGVLVIWGWSGRAAQLPQIFRT